MLDDVIVFGQNSIKFDMDKKIYIDPFQIKDNYNDADIIFITHDHYDHFSLEDIEKVRKYDTLIVAPICMQNLLSIFTNTLLVEVGRDYQVLGVSFTTVPSYNVQKKFHSKEKGYVGYILNLNGYKYYIAGDTDNLDELKNISCDVAFVPIGGTFTMDYREAADLVATMKPKIAIPVHYGSIVGSVDDGNHFKKLLCNSGVEVVLLIK